MISWYKNCTGKGLIFWQIGGGGRNKQIKKRGGNKGFLLFSTKRRWEKNQGILAKIFTSAKKYLIQGAGTLKVPRT